MLITSLTDQELETLLKRIQAAVRVQFHIWKDKIINTESTEAVFNHVEEVIYKTQMADEIMSGMPTFKNSMYITEGDYEQIIINLIKILETGKDILTEMYASAIENPDFNIIERGSLVEAAYEQYADEMYETEVTKNV